MTDFLFRPFDILTRMFVAILVPMMLALLARYYTYKLGGVCVPGLSVLALPAVGVVIFAGTGAIFLALRQRALSRMLERYGPAERVLFGGPQAFSARLEGFLASARFPALHLRTTKRVVRVSGGFLLNRTCIDADAMTEVRTQSVIQTQTQLEHVHLGLIFARARSLVASKLTVFETLDNKGILEFRAEPGESQPIEFWVMFDSVADAIRQLEYEQAGAN